MFRSPPGARIVITLLGLALSSPSPATEPPSATAPNCTPDTPGECLDGVSTGVTGGEGLRTITGAVSPASRERESDDERQAFGQWRHSGRAAGELASGWGVWASGGYTDFDGDPVFGTAISRFEGELANGLLGADVTLGSRLVLGVALGVEDSDTDTAFNGGGIETDGFTLAPYALYIFNDYVSVDVSLGYSWLDNEQRRIDPTDSAPGAPVFLRGGFDAERWFLASNLNGMYTSGRWIFGAQLGILKTEENQDGYTETGGSSARTSSDRRMSLSQGHLSVDAAYSFGSWEPYARAGYYHDFSRDDGQQVGGLPGGNVRTQFDANAWRFAAGLRYYGNRLSGGVEVQTEQGRDNFESTSVVLSVRGDF